MACGGRDQAFVLLDQLEESFVYHEDDAALGQILSELVTRTELPVRLLLGIREDALARLDTLKRHAPDLLGNCLRLDHLSRDAGRQAIRRPVERFAEIVRQRRRSRSNLVLSRPCSTVSGLEQPCPSYADTA